MPLGETCTELILLLNILIRKEQDDAIWQIVTLRKFHEQWQRQCQRQVQS
jgi:hypothetical protein